MNAEMMDALQALAVDRGISVETLLTVLADAMQSAYEKMPDAYPYAWVVITPETGEFKVMAQETRRGRRADRRRVRRHPAQLRPHRRAGLQAGHDPEDPRGRARAQVRGVRRPRGRHRHRHHPAVRRPVHAARPRSGRGAPAPVRAGVQYERAEPGRRVKAYIVEVRRTAKGPQIVVSRTHPGLIRRLFELEVPEIADGVVEIRACAREPGQRTKIAVWSNDPNVDPVGACVGARGGRVRMVVNELNGEKIDIVPFSRRPRGVRHEGARPGQGQRGPDRLRHRHRQGDRARLPAVAGHRQGGPERPPRPPPGRPAGRHRVRDADGRGWRRSRRRPTGPRASGSPTPRPASRCGSRPTAARRSRRGVEPGRARPAEVAPVADGRDAEADADDRGGWLRTSIDAEASRRDAADEPSEATAEADDATRSTIGGRRAIAERRERCERRERRAREEPHSRRAHLHRVPPSHDPPTSWCGSRCRPVESASWVATDPDAAHGCVPTLDCFDAARPPTGLRPGVASRRRPQHWIDGSEDGVRRSETPNVRG